jgi:hypothetical protein
MRLGPGHNANIWSFDEVGGAADNPHFKSGPISVANGEIRFGRDTAEGRCLPPATYRYKLTGSELTFTRVGPDGCSDRREIFDSRDVDNRPIPHVWTRVR